MAALTMPSLVQNYREQATVNKLKKFYSIFSQAYLMAVEEYGTLDNWGLAYTGKVTDEEGNRVLTDEGLAATERFYDIMDIYFKRVSRTNKTKDFKNSKGNEYILADGTTIAAVHLNPAGCNANNENSYCGDFYLKTDVKTPMYQSNGLHNKNVFAFYFRPHKIVPFGLTTTEFALCKSAQDYSRCSAWVLYNRNMDYLHCDGLSWNGAKSCKELK